MARKNKPKNPFERFESQDPYDAFIRISRRMDKSKAWGELDLRQIGLMYILKSKFTKNKIGEHNGNNITFPKSEWSKYYSRKDAFDKDMDKLIELGFIKVVLYRGNMRLSTIYGFSDQWINYGTDRFIVTNKDRRPKDTLSEEHKKAIGDKAKETNEKRYKPDNEISLKII